jgi:hypothetical protein
LKKLSIPLRQLNDILCPTVKQNLNSVRVIKELTTDPLFAIDYGFLLGVASCNISKYGQRQSALCAGVETYCTLYVLCLK